MKIIMTLSEILHRCNDWNYFCEETGWSEWCVNEGGGDIEVELTEEDLKKYGINKEKKNG